jgi:type II secretory pathway pseudopilin PulG
MNRQRGMTIIELLVSITIVMIIIGAATTTYLKILRTYKTQGRLAEGYMANLTGMELLRYDIQMAGFGLPINVTGVNYNEAVDGGVPYSPASLNDSANNPATPRAFAHLDSTNNGSDVLAIKSSAASVNPMSKKWSMIIGATAPVVKMWGGTVADGALDFAPNDMFIVLDNSYQLMTKGGAWSFAFSNAYYTNATNLPAPANDQKINYIYGLDSGNVRMPFNRVDYHLGPGLGHCAANTSTLYRSTVSQVDGSLSPAPLIDCVQDFQVAFGLALNNTVGNVDTWVANLGGMSANQIQQQVREVRVFLLYQEGSGDAGKSADFRFSGTLNLGDQDIAKSLDATYVATNTFQQLSSGTLTGNPALSFFTPQGPQCQYRWKVLEMAIKPVNLITRQ